ncbi:Anaphase-promoting subunit 15 MND2 protein [Rutstroemia sp. NJR-2017a WRK4]|nr:Anaphase-promoting subunit 15 MND2 protein [Rutstroemia sp. NJR-2017a WRK4]
MFSLPNLAPTDSYSLWYTSSHSNPPQHIEPAANSFDQSNPHLIQHQNHGSRRQAINNRTPLVRLRLDEEYIERRKQNVQNWGSSWIKPPGVPKSLYQLREEKREMEEHQEALRREQLAQELAEAEAEALMPDDGMDGDGDMDDVVDLDDEIPEADATGLGGDETEDSEDEENDTEEVPRGVLASRMPDRETLVYGEPAGTEMFGGDDGSTIDDEERSGMLQEEDLIHEHGMEEEGDMDMDADMDADIPESEEGYEHTDTEEEIDSSEEEEESEAESLPQVNPGASMIRSDGTQNSMDLSNLISHDSSLLQSSPYGRPGR